MRSVARFFSSVTVEGASVTTSIPAAVVCSSQARASASVRGLVSTASG